MSISKAVIMGTVVRNPEKRYTSNNVPITFFSINIGKDQEPSLLRIIAKGKLADSASETVTKGKVVIVEGKLQTATVKDSKGNEKKTMEIDARSVEVVSQAAVTGTEEESISDLDFADELTPDELIGEDEIPF